MHLFQEKPFASISKDEWLRLVYGIWEEEPNTDIPGDGIYIRPVLWILSLYSQN